MIAALEQLLNAGITQAFIDIPLGYAEGQYRTCEVQAQALLGPKRSSVFLTPCKRAVYAASFAEANRINKVYVGKGLSIQAWNICRKIKEANEFADSQSHLLLYEAHPELCFYSLNNNRPLLSKKSLVAGINERRNLIALIESRYIIAIDEMMGNTKKKDVKMDDILDATVIAIRASSSKMQTVPVSGPDEKGSKIFF